MTVKKRLIILNFLELFIWGSWLLSSGVYMTNTLKFSGVEVGSVHAVMGIASIFMPTVFGIIADRYISAEKLFGVSQFVIAGLFMLLINMQTFNSFYVVMFLISLIYMPTLALNNSISYYILDKNNKEVVKEFPHIRVWGTIGFIVAAWFVNFFELKASSGQFYISAIASVILGFYAFTLPKVLPDKSKTKETLSKRLGLDAFGLFKHRRTGIFLFFSVLLGAILQVTNIWGVPFLSDFASNYKDSFVVKQSVFLATLSQISEVIFIITIPFFLKRFGIKTVALISMFAWVFRFLLFGIGNPEGIGLFFLILSMIVYGMAFDFFFVSGSLFIEKEVTPKIRSSAQGIFMMMTAGVGPILGGYGSGYIVDVFTENGVKDWSSIWLSFSFYSLVIAVAFLFAFKYKHTSQE